MLICTSVYTVEHCCPVTDGIILLFFFDRSTWYYLLVIYCSKRSPFLMLNAQEVWCLFVTDTHRKSHHGSQCVVVLGTIYQLSLLHIPIIAVH